MKTIYLASGNIHKLNELQAALEQAGLSLEVVGPHTIGGMPEVEETGSTFESNALLKAHGLREVGPSEGWFLADDSGRYGHNSHTDVIARRERSEGRGNP